MLSSIFVVFTVFESAMGADEDKLEPLKVVQKQSLADLQKIKAVVKYTWLPEPLGNTLNVKNGELAVFCWLIEEEHILSVYKQFNVEIKAGIEFEDVLIIKTDGSMSHTAVRYRSKKEMKLDSSKSFIGQQALFGSGGPIEFASPLFDFDTCFIDVNPQKTTIKIAPHASVKSPIKYILIKPKSSPLLIQGKIDFKMPSFKDFIVSRSDFEIHFH